MSRGDMTVPVTEYVKVAVLICDCCGKKARYGHSTWAPSYTAGLSDEDSKDWSYFHGEDFCTSCALRLHDAMKALKASFT